MQRLRYDLLYIHLEAHKTRETLVTAAPLFSAALFIGSGLWINQQAINNRILLQITPSDYNGLQSEFTVLFIYRLLGLFQVVGEIQTPTWLNSMIAQLMMILFIGSIVMMFTSEAFLDKFVWIHLNQNYIVTSIFDLIELFFNIILVSKIQGFIGQQIKTLKLNYPYALTIIAVGANMLSTQFSQTGAFEVWHNDQLLFSKLATGLLKLFGFIR